MKLAMTDKPRVNRVSSTDSVLSVLEQRLRWVAKAPDRDWANIIESVPRWPSPPAIAASSFAELDGYAPCNGSDGLIERVRRREAEVHGVRAENDQVLITNGALHAIALILQSIDAPRAVALCQAPMLASIAELFKTAGFTLRFCGSPQGELNVDAIEEACASGVSVIYINTPHNPTGAICDRRSLERLVELAARRRIVLIADMVYDAFAFGARATSPLCFAHDWSNVFAVSSMSKNYGAPGLRIGWLMSSAENISRAAGALERECISVSGISQRQAEHLFDHGNEALVARVRDNVGQLRAILQRAELDFTEPDGGTQIWVELPVRDVEELADYVLVEHSVVLATASNYAGTEKPCIRVPIGAPVEVLARAIGRLEEGLRDYRARGFGR